MAAYISPVRRSMSAAPKIVNRVLSGKSRPSPEALLDEEPGTVSIPGWDDRMGPKGSPSSSRSDEKDTAAFVAPKDRDLTQQWKTSDDFCDRIEDASEADIQRSIAKQRLRMAGLTLGSIKEDEKPVSIRVPSHPSAPGRPARRTVAADDFSNLPDLL